MSRRWYRAHLTLIYSQDVREENPVASISSNVVSGTFAQERRETGHVFPTLFTPSSPLDQPTQLFRAQVRYGGITRYVHYDCSNQVLVFTDGACLNNGQLNPKAGWAVFHGSNPQGRPAIISGRLENVGPSNVQTNNRAELRAVIAALQYEALSNEGFKNIAIATDSEYVAKGATE